MRVGDPGVAGRGQQECQELGCETDRDCEAGMNADIVSVASRTQHA